MRIGIDATGVQGIKEGEQSGLTTYTVHIVKNLIEMDNDNKYYIYCRNEVPHQLITVSSSVIFRVFKSKNRKLLQQIRLPIAALFDRLDLMFFPYHSASIFCPCNGIVTIHDLHPFVVPERFTKIHSVQIHGSTVRSMINSVYWKKILKIASHKMDRVIAVSHATKRDMENIFHIPSEKIDMVHEGVDKEYFNLDSNGKDLVLFRKKYNLSERYILCVGTHAYKNIEGSLKAFSIIKKKITDPLKLVIAGNKQTLGTELFQIVKKLNLESQIIFTDFFPDEDLKYLYQCAELLLFPSFYEGFGLPVLEAFACGTPVVTSTAGSLPEVAGEAGLLVDPTDPEEIASSVFKLLTDDDFRDKKRQQGLKQVEKFSWEEAARMTLDIFEKMG